MTGMIQAPTVNQAVIPNINIGGFAESVIRFRQLQLVAL